MAWVRLELSFECFSINFSTVVDFPEPEFESVNIDDTKRGLSFGVTPKPGQVLENKILKEDNEKLNHLIGENSKLNQSLENIINMIRSLKEEAPVNNASSGAIAGLPPDSPPVKKKKKYIYGGHGSRKMWLANKKDGWQ
mgnify:CR=1 FL=1